MNGHKLNFCAPSETCDCSRRVGSCRWFKCGQPGPQEHAYKCEVFYATAGNFMDEPARLRNISLLVAHVLGYSGGAPHVFGACGKLWTLCALLYRLRDGAMASSMALLLTPRPVPVSLVPLVQKLCKSEKPYRPRSHRFFDTNPFQGLGLGRSGIERKLNLSHVAIAVWSAHASWLAAGSLGQEVNWAMWQLDHIAPPPSQLLGMEKPVGVMRKSLSSSMLKDLPSTSFATPRWVVTNHSSTPSTSNESDPRPETPPILQPRPLSFAGFTDWQHASTLPNIRPVDPPPTAKANHRLSCIELNSRMSGSPSRRLPETPILSAPRGIMVLHNENDSTYFLANESMTPDYSTIDDFESARSRLHTATPRRARNYGVHDV